MARRGDDADQPLIKSDGAAAVALAAIAVFVAYLVFQAWAGPAQWRVWALVGATGLALMTGAVAWSRFGKRR